MQPLTRKKILNTGLITLISVFLMGVSSCTQMKSTYFQELGKLKVPMNGFTATLLKDGTILVVGSPSNVPLTFEEREKNTAQIFDPRTGKATVISPLHRMRSAHRAILLDDGRVLLYDGMVNLHSPKDPYHYMVAEIYDPRKQIFTPIIDKKTYQAAEDGELVKLSNGKILILAKYTANVFEFDPVLNQFKKLGRSNRERSDFSTVWLPRDKVFIIGDHLTFQESPYQKFEIYDIQNHKSQTFGGLYANNPDMHTSPAVILLKTGKILVAYNEPISFYDPKTYKSDYKPSVSKLIEVDPKNKSVLVVAQTPVPKVLAFAFLLPDGRVIFPGGQGFAKKWWSERVDAFELYDPKTKSLKAIDALPEATMPIPSSEGNFYLIERTPENPQKVFIFNYQKFKQTENEGQS